MATKLLKQSFIIIMALLVGAQLAIASGSCVFSAVEGQAQGGQQDLSKELTWICTSDVNGTISSPTITGTGYNSSYTGTIFRASITPGTVRRPSNNYTIKLYSGSDTSDDLLGALGVNASNSTRKVDTPISSTNSFARFLFAETLTPYATGMGNATTTTLKVLIVK